MIVAVVLETEPMFKPVEIKALPGYRLYVRFAGGVAGEVDLSKLVGKGVFAAWNNTCVFEQVSIGTSGEIRWNDQIDLCPDAVYLQITGKTPEEVFPSLSGVAANS